MLNRYIDIYEMIEEGEADNIDEMESFNCTDIPSLANQRLPNKNHITEEQKNKLRDWCLKMSLEKPECANLRTHSCPQCGKAIFQVKRIYFM